MRIFPFGAAAAAVLAGGALANDACETAAIETEASVSVSNGRIYKTHSYFRSRHEAAIDFIDDDVTTIAFEGPLVWTRGGGKSAPAGEAEKYFAMGHQFHAQLLHFDEIFEDVSPSGAIPFRGNSAAGRSGAFGRDKAYLIAGDDGRARGLRLEPEGRGPVEVGFSDWRSSGGRDLPWIVTIHDGDDVYTYRYENISVGEQSPLWFHEKTGRPGLDAVEIYRLHRQTLAAHCLGDAALFARFSTPEGIVANRGELYRTTAAEGEERFTRVFAALDYTSYEDLAEPIVEVSADGTMGWIGVKVRAGGFAKESKEPFSTDWAWILLAKKVDGVWLGAGNASNQAPAPE